VTRSLRQITESIAGFDVESLRVEIAQEAIAHCIQPISHTDRVPLKQALGRTLASDITAPINVPSYNNSAMDGYAFRGADLKPGETTLQIVGKAFAGHAYTKLVNIGECVRIMTGALMPRGCNSVIPQELVTVVNDQTIRFASATIKPGVNVRLAGEDLSVGETVLRRRRLITPSDLGVIASLGLAELSVTRKLKVAFFSTGDELRSIGEVLDEGCVYDSNRYTLQAMLDRAGFDAIDFGVVRDDPSALEKTLRDACSEADAVITTGGVSAGDADYTRALMARLGEVMFWKIAMRPGRPMAFGQLNVDGKNTVFFGLPGNPVAVMATFYFFAREALLRLQGTTPNQLPMVRAISTDLIRKRPGRTEYQRGVLTYDTYGNAHVRLTGAQGSGILSSMSDANCMVVLAHDEADIQAGESVIAIPFTGLI
jgi:molybdopterin molybdotransferase